MRYRSTFPLDDATGAEGDGAFVGVNAKAAPDKLPPGLVASATNLRFRDGAAATRAGSYLPRFARLTGLVATPPTVIYDAALWSDPRGKEWLLLATDTGVWQVRDGHTPRQIETPEALVAGDYCALVQAFDRMLLFRGAEKTPWVWSGARTEAFEIIPKDEPGDEVAPIPNGTDRAGLRPVLLNRRLIVPHGRNRLAVSDLLDYTTYDATFADFNLSAGNDDTLTAIYPYSRDGLLCFKDQSIALLSGIAGTLAPALELVNREVGCVAGRTVASVGADVFFLAHTGVFRVSQVVEGRIATQPVPVSDPIEPLIRRINWRAVATSCAAVHGEYYYLAVPLDQATRPNALLPFNTVTGAWEGVHEWDCGAIAVRFDALLVTDFLRERCLFGIGFTGPHVLRLYDGTEDILSPATDASTTDPDESAYEYFPVQSELATRAYTLGDNGQKRFRRARLAIETWKPSVQVSSRTDGVQETALLGSFTRSRTRSVRYGAGRWYATNSNDDHGTRAREDYSVKLDPPMQLGSGVVLNRHQAASEAFPVNERGRSAQIIVANATGRVRILSTQVEANQADRGLTSKI